jgi:uncharacterized small protein (DUF1192 family)
MPLRLKNVEELDRLGLPPEMLQRAKNDFAIESGISPSLGDLSALSDSELQIRVEAERAEITKLETEIEEKQQYLTAARWRLGKLLSELKRRCEHGEWEPLLKRYKIRSQRASEDKRIAEFFASEEEAGKVPVEEALRLVKRSAAEYGPYDCCFACPKWLREAITRDYGYPGLDVASSHGMEFGERFYSPPGDSTGFRRNGLRQDWKRDCNGRIVWCNPPYKKEEIGAWVRKAYGEAQKRCVVVCMLPFWRSHGWLADWVIPYAEIRLPGASVILQGFGPMRGSRCGNVDSVNAYETIIAVFRKRQRGFISGWIESGEKQKQTRKRA